MTFSEFTSWLSAKSIEEKIPFMERFLFYFTVMNRGIWSDPNTSDQEKIEALKWSNELAHQIWNLLHELKRGENDGSAQRLADQINFYRQQSTVLASHLGGTIPLTVQSFDRINTSN